MTSGVRVNTPCVVCDDPDPVFRFTDLHGEGSCSRCGTAHMLIGFNGRTERDCSLAESSWPILRRYWAEVKRDNGSGTYFGSDYHDRSGARSAFFKWFRENYPEGWPADSAEPSEGEPRG